MAAISAISLTIPKRRWSVKGHGNATSTRTTGGKVATAGRFVNGIGVGRRRPPAVLHGNISPSMSKNSVSSAPTRGAMLISHERTACPNTYTKFTLERGGDKIVTGRSGVGHQLVHVAFSFCALSTSTGVRYSSLLSRCNLRIRQLYNASNSSMLEIIVRSWSEKLSNSSSYTTSTKCAHP